MPWQTERVRRRDIADYLNRDWESVRAVGDEYWARRKRELGPEAGLAVSDELRLQVISMHRDFPQREQREMDLRVHTRVARLLRYGKATRGA